MLLFGPPGTGKTLLAKAVCSSQRASFFSCAASSLVSKFRGESEKIVRCLFEAARFSAPSVIFLDELDALVGKRSTEGQVDGHEASRRLKTELFTQMDGLGSDGTGLSVSGIATCYYPYTHSITISFTSRGWLGGRQRAQSSSIGGDELSLGS